MRIFSLIAWVSAAGLLLIVFGIRLSDYGYAAHLIFDDAFFFVRYAGNFLDTGVFEWNRGEGAVYGNTSQTYQFLVTLVYWLTGGNGVLSLNVAATTGAIAYFIVLPFAYAASRPQLEPNLRLIVCALVACAVVLDRQLYILTDTAMEATWTMALVAVSMMVTSHLENGSDGRGMVVLSASIILLLFATRPDAIMIVLAGPAWMILVSRDRRARACGLAICLSAATAIAVFLLACWAYYGDALPLSSATKLIGITIWPSAGKMEGEHIAPFFVMQTLSFHKIETLLALGSFLLFFRFAPSMQGAMLGTLLFIVYHLYFVLPIMGHFGRLNAAMVPVLILAAARTVESAVEYVRLRSDLRIRRRSAIAGALALTLYISYKAGSLVFHTVSTPSPIVTMPAAINTSDGAMKHAANSLEFFKGILTTLMDAAGSECSIASSEHGVMSAYSQHHRIVDISGLHDRRMAREGFSADRLLIEQRPDVLVFPPLWFREWIVMIDTHPALKRDYITESPVQPRAPRLAFRRDSACALNAHKAIYGR